MGIKALSLLVACVGLSVNVAQADNPNNCQWVKGWPGGERPFSMTAPSLIEQKMAPVGSVMATSSVTILHNELRHIKCIYPDIKTYQSTFYMNKGAGIGVYRCL